MGCIVTGHTNCTRNFFQQTRETRLTTWWSGGWVEVKRNERCRFNAWAQVLHLGRGVFGGLVALLQHALHFLHSLPCFGAEESPRRLRGGGRFVCRCSGGGGSGGGGGGGVTWRWRLLLLKGQEDEGARHDHLLRHETRAPASDGEGVRRLLREFLHLTQPCLHALHLVLRRVHHLNEVVQLLLLREVALAAGRCHHVLHGLGQLGLEVLGHPLHALADQLRDLVRVQLTGLRDILNVLQLRLEGREPLQHLLVVLLAAGEQLGGDLGADAVQRGLGLEETLRHLLGEALDILVNVLQQCELRVEHGAVRVEVRLVLFVVTLCLLHQGLEPKALELGHVGYLLRNEVQLDQCIFHVPLDFLRVDLDPYQALFDAF